MKEALIKHYKIISNERESCIYTQLTWVYILKKDEIEENILATCNSNHYTFKFGAKRIEKGCLMLYKGKGARHPSPRTLGQNKGQRVKDCVKILEMVIELSTNKHESRV